MLLNELKRKESSTLPIKKYALELLDRGYKLRAASGVEIKNIFDLNLHGTKNIDASLQSNPTPVVMSKVAKVADIVPKQGFTVEGQTCPNCKVGKFVATSLSDGTAAMYCASCRHVDTAVKGLIAEENKPYGANVFALSVDGSNVSIEKI